MLHLTWESFVQYGSSNAGGYQFVYQDVSYLLSLIYTFLYNHYIMPNVMNSLLWITFYLFYLDLVITY